MLRMFGTDISEDVECTYYKLHIETIDDVRFLRETLAEGGDCQIEMLSATGMPDFNLTADDVDILQN